MTFNLAVSKKPNLKTDTATTIEFYAIDVDPCTGVETERSLVIAQPSSVAPVGEVIYRLGKQDVSPATREVGFRYTNGPSPVRFFLSRDSHPKLTPSFRDPEG